MVEGTQYYIGIAVYDSDGYESLMNEKIGIPNSIPIAPAGLSEKALWHAVEINWLNNLELDLIGYNIYRSTPSTEDTLLRLNTSVLTDTFFIDTSPQNGFYHNYYISALDSSFNESLLSQPIVSRCVSLDQGILVIDETSDGDGTIYKPTDEEVDNFYDSCIQHPNVLKVVALSGGYSREEANQRLASQCQKHLFKVGLPYVQAVIFYSF